MKSEFIKELGSGAANFELADRWRAKNSDGELFFFTELLSHPRFNGFMNAVNQEQLFSIFDDNKIHRIANYGSIVSRRDVAAWAIKRALITDARTAADDIWRYRSRLTVKGYQVLLVEGLYFESSDDVADFNEEIRVLPLMHAPVELLRSLAFKNELFQDIDTVVCRPTSLTRSIQKQGTGRDHALLNRLPRFDDMEDRILLLSLVAKRGFQIAGSSYAVDDSVPVLRGMSYSSHSRRAPVKLASPIIDWHTTEAERLYSLFDGFSEKKKKRLRVAMGKLNDHLSEVGNAQAIADLRTCLESLFLDNSKEGEYRYRLSLRAAFFAGDNPAERQQYFKSVRRCYDLGSEAVHTGSVTFKNNDDNDIKSTVEVIRKSIFKVINGASLKFDTVIFGAEEGAAES